MRGQPDRGPDQQAWQQGRANAEHVVHRHRDQRTVLPGQPQTVHCPDRIGKGCLYVVKHHFDVPVVPQRRSQIRLFSPFCGSSLASRRQITVESVGWPGSRAITAVSQKAGQPGTSDLTGRGISAARVPVSKLRSAPQSHPAPHPSAGKAARLSAPRPAAIFDPIHAVRKIDARNLFVAVTDRRLPDRVMQGGSRHFGPLLVQACRANGSGPDAGSTGQADRSTSAVSAPGLVRRLGRNISVTSKGASNRMNSVRRAQRPDSAPS